MHLQFEEVIIMQFKELTQTYRGLLDKTIEKLNSLIKDKYTLCVSLAEIILNDNNDCQKYSNLCNGDIEAFIQEVHESISGIKKSELKSQLDFLKTLEKEYTRISSQKGYSDKTNSEMREHLCFVVKNFGIFIDSAELSENTLPLLKTMENLFQNEPKHIPKIEQFKCKMYECKQQYRENLYFLQALIEYFSVPTECPPHI